MIAVAAFSLGVISIVLALRSAHWARMAERQRCLQIVEAHRACGGCAALREAAAKTQEQHDPEDALLRERSEAYCNKHGLPPRRGEVAGGRVAAKQIRKLDDCGSNWFGEPEAVQRIMAGFGTNMAAVLKEIGIADTDVCLLPYRRCGT